MKKKELYSIHSVFNNCSDIMCMVCSCAAGIGPTSTCKHVGVLCYFMEKLCRLSIDESYSTSCTSKLQTCHHPPHKRPSSAATTLGNIKFVKLEHGKIKKMLSSNYDPRPLQFRGTKQSEINNLRESLIELPIPVAFEQVLPLQAVSASTPEQETQLPLVPRSVQIRLQAELKSQHQPISLDSLDVLCKTFLEQITISEEDIVRVEAATRDQSQSPRWHHERQCRITSSSFGIFCKGCISACKVKTLLYDTDTTSKVSSSAILWGKLHESTAFEQYSKSLAPNEHIRHCDIYILKHDGFLAASPDGIVTSDNGGTIEIKCPYSCRSLSVRDSCRSLKSFPCEIVDDQIRLKTNHSYYY